MKRILYCTYCSAGKNRKRGKIPAVRRYTSSRIRAIHRKSRKDGAAFAILSGQFGLLGPFQGIPYYDHLLAPGEVDGLLPQMVEYLQKRRVRSVRFFHESLKAIPRIRPYCDAIEKACRRAHIPLSMIKLPS